MPPLSRAYQSLLNDIAELYTETRASVVRMYWEIGQLLELGHARRYDEVALEDWE